MSERDMHGREVQPGDLIRIYHYKDARTGRKCYMYKIVVLVTDSLQVSKAGTYLFCVDVVDIWERVSLDRAHKARLDAVGEFEIIDGPSRRVNGELETWYEREKVK